MSTEVIYARSWDQGHTKSQSLNIYTHNTKAVSDTALSEAKPATLNSKQRMRFWSKFKRSKSQNINNYHTKSNAIPQRAKSDANLVWCPEQKIWLFARQPANHSSPSSQSQPKTTATAILPPRAEYDEEELLFAQLPGHYCLGIYTEVNNEPVSPCQPDFFDFSAQKALGGSRWMSVAQRVGPGSTMS
ncbi:hypothetical protein MGYG_01024 [Nannizzia gypsea CBS 118893]|uniref:Uncharacterized protein n=1 Tax=Arthroderma gypseum (strain ATCC MYA-4604 / CBS 118893) TaxID=535722 RepID=E5R3S8_ARTGP|nr:hypothetical protein MGYG_01024 [Nannizzia gypsea CBS 118893]EFQ97988.1 hypothetical protein MGYG_01024 [Nannizzia gypsea CBS 118893]